MGWWAVRCARELPSLTAEAPDVWHVRGTAELSGSDREFLALTGRSGHVTGTPTEASRGACPSFRAECTASAPGTLRRAVVCVRRLSPLSD
jgi:hypothetical protein